MKTCERRVCLWSFHQPTLNTTFSIPPVLSQAIENPYYFKFSETPKSAIAQEISHLARMSEATKPRNENNDEQIYMDESEQSSSSDDESYNNDYIPNNENLLEKLNNLRNDIIEEEDIAVKSALLLKLLEVRFWVLYVFHRYGFLKLGYLNNDECFLVIIEI